jgi:hypothetical protein
MLKNKDKIFLEKSLNRKIKLFFGQEYFKSRIVRWFIVLAVFFNFVNWSILKFFLRPSGNSIILHYNVYFGVDSMGIPRESYELPLIGVIILLINVALSLYFYAKKERIACYILLITALMAQLSLLISVISVIIINY